MPSVYTTPSMREGEWSAREKLGYPVPKRVTALTNGNCEIVERGVTPGGALWLQRTVGGVPDFSPGSSGPMKRSIRVATTIWG